MYVGGSGICSCHNVHVDAEHSFVELVLSIDHLVGSDSGGSNSDQIMRLSRQAPMGLKPGPQQVVYCEVTGWYRLRHHRLINTFR